MVFDWEFAFKGPRIIDIGHFLRWEVSTEFLEQFIVGYAEVTSIDITNLLKPAKYVDLINLAFQLEKSYEGGVRETDILDYLETLVSLEIYANKPLQRT